MFIEFLFFGLCPWCECVGSIEWVAVWVVWMSATYSVSFVTANKPHWFLRRRFAQFVLVARRLRRLVEQLEQRKTAGLTARLQQRQIFTARRPAHHQLSDADRKRKQLLWLNKRLIKNLIEGLDSVWNKEVKVDLKTLVLEAQLCLYAEPMVFKVGSGDPQGSLNRFHFIFTRTLRKNIRDRWIVVVKLTWEKMRRNWTLLLLFHFTC